MINSCAENSEQELTEKKDIKRIAVLGTFDTKGKEFSYLCDSLREHGMNSLTIDVSMQGDSPFSPDVTAAQVAEAASSKLDDIQASEDRSDALEIMSNGATSLVLSLLAEGKIDGIISMGGSQGSHIASKVFEKLPIGFPKIIITTILGHNGLSSIFSNVNDTLVMNSIVDISGTNYIFETIVEEASSAMEGMIYNKIDHNEDDEKKLRIGISMWGVTTVCADEVRSLLEQAGYEVYMFHATGMGGNTMENLVQIGQLQGIVDITMSELGNTLCKVNCVPTPDRLRIIAQSDVPAVISVGGLDMLSMFQPFDELPEQYVGRQEYYHADDILFVRSTPEENRMFGEEIASRLGTTTHNVRVIVPLKGISANDIDGGVLYNPEADTALFDSLRENLDSSIELIEIPVHINDEEFAECLADNIMELMEKKYGGIKWESQEKLF